MDSLCPNCEPHDDGSYTCVGTGDPRCQDPAKAPAAAATVVEPSAAAPVPSSSVADIVERWWSDHFPGSPVARDTAIWNYAHEAKEELKRRLGVA